MNSKGVGHLVQLKAVYPLCKTDIANFTYSFFPNEIFTFMGHVGPSIPCYSLEAIL